MYSPSIRIPFLSQFSRRKTSSRQAMKDEICAVYLAYDFSFVLGLLTVTLESVVPLSQSALVWETCALRHTLWSLQIAPYLKVEHNKIAQGNKKTQDIRSENTRNTKLDIFLKHKAVWKVHMTPTAASMMLKTSAHIVGQCGFCNSLRGRILTCWVVEAIAFAAV